MGIRARADPTMEIAQMKNKAFTLIELLIVVAIIAILAAIAVPNFLEAQVRSKVSRAKADMRSLATAVEAYSVDHNHYPLAVSLEDPGEFTMFSGIEPIESLAPFTVTTPVAYITSLPRDIFPDKEQTDTNQTFHYLDRQTADRRNEPTLFEDYHEALYGTRQNFGYWMFTVGPDLNHDEDLSGGDPDLATALYDPTNGTVSSGDIYYFQGKGFGK